MPCSSRACRLENELTNGSLGAIFHFTGSPFGHARASLPWTRRGELLRRNNFPQMVLGEGRRHSFRLGRGLRLLVGHLGECTGRDPKDKDPDAPHAECEARHTRPSAVPQSAFNPMLGPSRTERRSALGQDGAVTNSERLSITVRVPWIWCGTPTVMEGT
jgi:hypothetical protein